MKYGAHTRMGDTAHGSIAKKTSMAQGIKHSNKRISHITQTKTAEKRAVT